MKKIKTTLVIALALTFATPIPVPIIPQNDTMIT